MCEGASGAWVAFGGLGSFRGNERFGGLGELNSSLSPLSSLSFPSPLSHPAPLSLIHHVRTVTAGIVGGGTFEKISLFELRDLPRITIAPQFNPSNQRI